MTCSRWPVWPNRYFFSSHLYIAFLRASEFLIIKMDGLWGIEGSKVFEKGFEEGSS